MPLRKLWNSIVGGGSPAAGNPSQRTQEQRAQEQRSQDAPQPAPVATRPPAASRGKPAASRGKPAASRGKRVSVSKDDKRIGKQVVALNPQSVLEVCLGDGARAISIVSSLTHKGHSTPVNYIAIDAFEMGGGELSLRDFHKRLREFPAKAHLVPMSIDAGLDRVVSTFGQVDVIVWGNDAPPNAAQEMRLNRLSKPHTVLLIKQDNRWVESRLGRESRRAA